MVGRVARILVLASLLSLFILSALPRGYGQATAQDLALLGIALNPPSPVRKGDIVEVTTEIQNQGNQSLGYPSERIMVQFSYLGARAAGTFAAETKTLFFLDPGDKTTFSAELDTLVPQSGKSALPGGSYRISAQVFVQHVGPQGEITSEEPGGRTSTTLVVLEGETKPDLVLKEITFPSGPIIGKDDSFLLGATIYNGGTEDAETVEVSFSSRLKGQITFEDEGIDETGDELKRGPPEEASSVFLTSPFSKPPGIYLIRAWVDPSNMIEELDEGNNILTRSLFVVNTARMSWAYPSFPIPIGRDEQEEKIGAIAATPGIGQVERTTVIYFGSDDGTLYALDSSGRRLWQYQAEGAVKTAPVLLPDSEGAVAAIFFGSDDGHLYAIDNTGSLNWKYPSSGAIGPVKAAPAIRLGSGGEINAIYFGSDDGNLYALNPDGSLRWQFAAGAFIRTTPAIATVTEGGVQKTFIYFGSGDGNLYALEDQGDKAALRWTFPTGSFIKSSPEVAGQTIYFGSSDGHLYALFIDGTKKWQYPIEGEQPIGAVESTPLVTEDEGITAIYFGSNDGSLHKLEEDEDGEMREGWVFHEYRGGFLGPVRSSPVRRGEIIYFGSDDGTLYAVKDRGTSVSDEWAFPTRGPITGSPAIEGSALYLPSWEGHLYALNLGAD